MKIKKKKEIPFIQTECCEKYKSRLEKLKPIFPDDKFYSFETIKWLMRSQSKESLKKSLNNLIEKQKRRGMKPRALRAMVCGIPNVGKSTFINTFAKRKAAQTGDRPGVTKSLQWIKVGQTLELLDTPGVLWPKFEDQQVGLKLALLGSVKDQVVNMDDLALFACEYLMQEKPEIFDTVYHVKIVDTPYETLQNIAIKRGYLLKGEIDENRLMLSFVKDIRENKCGLITWEKPHVG